MLQHTKSERHEEINAAVTGPLTSARRAAPQRVDPETGLPMPAWWSGDEQAAASALVARAQAPPR